MNFKKLSIIVITIISIFSFNNKVDAAQELTCFYSSGTGNSIGILLKQYEDGSAKLFYGYHANSVDGNVWYYVGRKNTNESTIEMLEKKQFKASTIIDDSSFNKKNELESCPKYRLEGYGKEIVQILSNSSVEDLRDEKRHGFKPINDVKYDNITSGLNARVYESYENSSKRIHYMNPSSQYGNKNNDWFLPIDGYDLSCLYLLSTEDKPFDIKTARVQIDVNDKEIRVNSSYNKSNEIIASDMSGNVIFNYISDSITKTKTEDSTKCPATITLYLDDSKNSRINIMYGPGQNGDHLDDAKRNYTFVLAKTSKEGKETATSELTYTKISEINSCEDILTDDIVKYIKILLNLIRIGVPIVIFVLTILDLSKAIFNGEEDMKKAKDKIIKRLIIAAAFFLVPTLLKVFLDIVSFIWPNIDSSLCGIFD